MSAITNQNTNNNSVGHNNGNGKIPDTRSEQDKNDMICWGCRDIGHGWRECATPRQSTNLPFKLEPPALSQHQPLMSQHQQTSKESWGAYGTEVPQS